MDKFISDTNISLLLPVASVFLFLMLHCYLYRGKRLTLTFFGSVVLTSYGREAAFQVIKKSSNMLPYQVSGNPLEIFHLPIVEYLGWAITFYLSWYLAERVLKRIGNFSDRLFPTIVWSLLIAGAISYCVETSAIRVGWWRWLLFDPRLKGFLLTPFSAIQGWAADAAFFFSVFLFSECSKYRAQWWRVFLYFLILSLIIDLIVYYIMLTSPIKIGLFTAVFDSLRILLPLVLMFFWPLSFKYGRLERRNLRMGLFLYDAIPLSALFFIMSICIGIEIIVLKEPDLIFSVLPLTFILLFSSKEVPVFFILFLSLILLISGNKLAYVISLPAAVFFAFWGFQRLREKYKFNLMKY